MGDLRQQGVGTNEIEKNDMRRNLERQRKNGLQPEEEGMENCQRNELSIKKQLSIRVQETKEDWRKAKEKFRNERAKVMATALKEGKAGKIKKELKRIDKYNNHQYQKGSQNHERKVQFLKSKYKEKQSPTKAAKSRGQE